MRSSVHALRREHRQQLMQSSLRLIEDLDRVHMPRTAARQAAVADLIDTAAEVRSIRPGCPAPPVPSLQRGTLARRWRILAPFIAAALSLFLTTLWLTE